MKGRAESSGEYTGFVRVIDAARCDAKDRPGALSRTEFDLALAKAVRSGSAQAMKLWAELNVSAIEPPPKPDEFDQMKASRAGV